MPNPLQPSIDTAVKGKNDAIQNTLDCITIGSLDMAMVHLLTAIKFESGENLLRTMGESM